MCTDREGRGGAPLGPRRGDGHPIVSSLVLYFALLLTMLAVGLVVEHDAAAAVAGGVVHTLIVLAWLLPGWSSVSAGLRNVASAKWYLAAVGLGAATFVLAGIIIRTAVWMFGLEEILLGESLLDAGYGWWALIVIACLQPGVVEELAFRGLILTAMCRVMKAREAIMVSALLFMTIHLAVASFPHLLVIGLVLGYLRIRSGSLYPCMLMHFTHNLLCVLFESWWG